MAARTSVARSLIACTLASLAAFSPSSAWPANSQTPFSKIPHLFFNNPAPAPMLAPSAVLSRYASALAELPSPRYLAFTFSIEQSGSHNLSQTHHVYRDGPNERDETTVADGISLHRPNVRIFRNRTNRYQLNEVAPRPSEYEFRLTGTQHDGDHDDYTFATTARYGGSFQITDMVVDGDGFLPIELDFTIGSGAMRGQGRLTYGHFDRFWLVREAEVTAHDASGKSSRERIVWTQYQFPDSLPPSTFNNAREAPDDEAFSPPPAAAPSAPPSAGTVSPRPAPATRPPATPVPSAPVPGPTVTKAPKPRPTHQPAAPVPEQTSADLPAPVTPAPLRTEAPPPVQAVPQTPAAIPAVPSPAVTGAVPSGKP